VDGDAASPGQANVVREGRKPRADGQRNRERLVEAAKAVFAEAGTDASLEAIARRAGVGIGTLYRHFPTRDAVVEAVYRRELQQLGDAARRLAAERTPGEALHAWMGVFVDYIAAKKLIAPALALPGADRSELYATAGATMTGAMSDLVARAKAAGDIRADADPEDLLRALLGFTYGNTSPGWRASALRLIEILMDGLKPPR